MDLVGWLILVFSILILVAIAFVVVRRRRRGGGFIATKDER